MFREEAAACSEAWRIELAHVFWVSLAFLVSCSHVRALLGGELTTAQGPQWKQKGARHRRGGWRLVGFRIGLALPSPWVGRFSKLGIEGSRRKGSGENTSPSSPIPGALPPPGCSLLLLQGCPDLPGGPLFNMRLTVSCGGAGSSAVAMEWEPCSVAARALAGLSPPSACLWLPSVEYGEGEALSGAGVPGHLRTGKSEPVWQRTKGHRNSPDNLYSPGTKAGQAGRISPGVLVGSPALLLRLYSPTGFRSPTAFFQNPPSYSEPLFLYGALSPPCVPI